MNDSTLQKAHLPAAPRTRRVFLTRAAALGITSATAGWLWNQRPRAGTVAISAAPVLGLARFLPLTGTVFTSAAPDALPGTELTLTEALPSKQHRPDVAEQFSLLFKASDLSPIESRIHQLHHPVLGSLELFISPVGAKPGVGEAIINYARQAA